MRFDVPEEFVKVLEEIEREVSPRRIIKWLEWASQNPNEAKHIAEAYKRLGRSGRHEFVICLLIGNTPDHALESAVDEDSEYRKKRSVLSKLIADAKKGGFKFRLPNGVECTVKRDDEEYRFNFTVAGEEISVIHSKRGLLYALEMWMKGEAPRHCEETIIYKGKIYGSLSNIGLILLKAIEENMKPEVLLAVNI